MKSRRRKLTRDKRNGQYYVRIQVGGVRKYFGLGTNRRKAEAEQTRLERLHDQNELEFGIAAEPAPEPLEVTQAGNEITLKEVIDIHLDWIVSNRSQGTCKMRAHYVQCFLRYAGNRAISKIDKLLLAGFHGWAKKYHSQGPNGGNVFLRNVKCMLLWAEDMGICPCPVRRFPLMRESPPETKRFTDADLKTLLACMKPMAPDFHDMIVFAVLTGLRPQELRALQRCHVIGDTVGEEYVEFQKHKTATTTRDPAKRTVPLLPAALQILERQIARHPWRLHVFLNDAGKPYTACVFRQRLRRWCKRAGIKPRPPYALRHTFGSMEAEANVNQTVIAQVMGHTQLRTTARYIAHNEEHHRKAIGYISARITNIANGDDAQPPKQDEETAE